MLALVDRSHPGSRSLLLGTGTYLVGRSSHCQLVINDLTVSRRHARVVVSDANIRVIDLKSQNGTFIDGKAISSATVEEGQTVRFGSVLFMVAKEEPWGDAIDSSPSTHSNLGRASNGKTTQFGEELLSAAERRILELLVDGLPEKQIAFRTDLSPHTVHNHVRAIYRAFGVHSRSELLAGLLHRK